MSAATHDNCSITRAAEYANLPALIDFAVATCSRLAPDESVVFAVRLAVEEICTNLVQHGYRGAAPGPISIDLRREDAAIVITISDRGRPFHPDSAPPPDLTSDLQQRRPGGLGVHLIKCFIDELSYEADARDGNRLTLVKRLSPSSP